MIVIALFLLWVGQCQVSHSPITPKVQKVKFSPIIKTMPSGTAFNQIFRSLGYEIGGTVYETHNGLLNEQIHNTSFYHKSTSCQFYNSKLRLHIINEVQLTIGISIQSLTISERLNEIYSIQSNNSYSDEGKPAERLLTAMPFSIEGIKLTSRNISISALGLNSSQKLDVTIVTAGDYIIITDGVKIVAVEAKKFSNHWELKVDYSLSQIYDYNFAEQNDLLHLKVCHFDPKTNITIIQATWNKAIRVYQITDNFVKGFLKNEFLPPKGTQFTDAIADHGRYWAIVEGKFIAYRPNKSGKFQSSIVELESKQCFGFNKFQTTVHIICRQQGLNYVGQYFLNQTFVKPSQALYLNRYYTQIDDAKTLFHFGGDYSPKLIISGDYDLQIVPYAVNRQALIQSVNIPRAQRLKSLGVQQIYSIANYSNLTDTFTIGIGQNYLVLFQVTEEPPQIECILQRTSSDIRWNLLVEINSSSCLANGDWEQLQSICTYQIPFTIYASLIQVDSTKHTAIVVTVFMLLLAIGIVLIGCALCCKNNLEKVGAQLKKRLAALKKQKEMKPI